MNNAVLRFKVQRLIVKGAAKYPQKCKIIAQHHSVKLTVIFAEIFAESAVKAVINLKLAETHIWFEGFYITEQNHHPFFYFKQYRIIVRYCLNTFILTEQLDNVNKNTEISLFRQTAIQRLAQTSGKKFHESTGKKCGNNRSLSYSHKRKIKKSKGEDNRKGHTAYVEYYFNVSEIFMYRVRNRLYKSLDRKSVV